MMQEVQIQLKQEVAVQQRTIVQMQVLACTAENLKACIETYIKNEPLIEFEQVSFEETLPEPPDEHEIWEDWNETSRLTDSSKRFEDYVSVPARISMREALMTQIRCIQMTEACYDAVFFLIDELTPDGYLPLESYEKAKTAYPETERALAILQDLDPSGIGARSVRECLEIQLRHMHCFDIIYHKLLDNLEDLAKMNFAKLEKNLRIPSNVVQSRYAVIKSLNPRPGASYLENNVQYIYPDVTVIFCDDGFRIQYNSKVRLRTIVREEYRMMLSQSEQSSELKKYIRTNIDKSSWINRCIEQREKTICQVCAEIVRQQIDFFANKSREIKPLTLRVIADQLGVHTSTVSRACAGKHMQTPVGTFPFSYFFSNAVVFEDKAISTSSIKDMINDIIKHENPYEPYSDQQLCDILCERYQAHISRRTIAKYRVQLNIADSKRRKSIR